MKSRLIFALQLAFAVALLAPGTVCFAQKPQSAAQQELLGVVRQVAFSPDGKTLASGGDDKVVRLWSARDGRLLRTFSGHTSYVWSVAFSPDSKIVASRSWDKTIKLWDVRSGKLLRTLSENSKSLTPVETFGPPAFGEVWSVAFSPDGKNLASGGADKIVRLWSVSNGELLHNLSGNADSITSVFFSLNGQTIASTVGKTVKLWEVNGSRLRVLGANAGGLHSIAFSPDGKTLASGGEDKLVKLWSASSGKLLRVLSGHSSGVDTVAFSPDGKTLASGSGGDRTIKVWNVVSGKLLRTLSGNLGLVMSVVFSPDSKTLVSGSGASSFAAYSTVKLWNVSSGHLLLMLGANSESVVPAGSGNKKVLAAAWARKGDAAAVVFDLAGGIAAYRKAVELDPSNLGYVLHLSGAYAGVGMLSSNQLMGSLHSLGTSLGDIEKSKLPTSEEVPDAAVALQELVQAKLKVFTAPADQEQLKVGLRAASSFFQTQADDAIDHSDYAQALDRYSRLLAIAPIVSDHEQEANALNGLGNVYDDLGQHERAVETYKKELALQRQTSKGEENIAVTLNNIGWALDGAEKSNEAITYYTQALAIENTISDDAASVFLRGTSGSALKSYTVGNLGLSYYRLKQTDKGIGLGEQALALMRKTANRVGEGKVVKGGEKVGHCGGVKLGHLTFLFV